MLLMLRRLVFSKTAHGLVKMLAWAVVLNRVVLVEMTSNDLLAGVDLLVLILIAVRTAPCLILLFLIRKPKSHMRPLRPHEARTPLGSFC
jgi:hypothetical protein